MIVSVDELIDFMSDITLTGDQRTAAKLVIEGVQGEMETYLNRSLEPTSRTETVVTDHNGQLWPRHTPVLSVSSAQAGDPLAAIAYDLDGDVLSAGTPGTVVLLTYVGGIGPEHRAYKHLRLEVLRVAAREMTKRHDDTLGVKDLNASDDSEPLPDGLQDSDRLRIRRWKRRTVA